MNKCNLQIPLFFSILFLTITAPALLKADDQVTITIQMSGDAYVTITNSNGSIVFYYNGENIMPSLLSDVDWLKTATNTNQFALELMRRDFNRLVNALNETFRDLYGKVYFLAHVTGVYNGNDNSTVTLMLKSGNMTLADFIDHLFNTVEKLQDNFDSQAIQIRNIKLEIASDRRKIQQKLNEAFNRISENREYFEAQLSEMNEKIDKINARLDAFEEQTNSTFAKVFDTLELLKMYGEVNANSTRIALIAIGILNVLMVIMIAWIAGKAKKP